MFLNLLISVIFVFYFIFQDEWSTFEGEEERIDPTSKEVVEKVQNSETRELTSESRRKSEHRVVGEEKRDVWSKSPLLQGNQLQIKN